MKNYKIIMNEKLPLSFSKGELKVLMPVVNVFLHQSESVNINLANFDLKLIDYPHFYYNCSYRRRLKIRN